MKTERGKCKWCLSDELSEKYHDEEWGVAVHDDQRHFEFLLMESMSCGLSWQMMLKRRDIFSTCFAQFDAAKVALFTEKDVERILQTERMIRSRRKIESIINNARCFMQVAQEFGTFDTYIWKFTNGQTWVYPSHQEEWCTHNELSDMVAKDLKKRGFKYVGSVIIYSHLQSIGLINDHAKDCYRYHQLIKSQPTKIRLA